MGEHLRWKSHIAEVAFTSLHFPPLYLHAVVVLVAAVPLPARLGDEWPEVGVAHVADVGGEAEEAPRLQRVVVPALLPQPVRLVRQAVLLHRALLS